VFKAQGKLDDALKAYRDSLAIRERLATADRSNTEWQRDVYVSLSRVADVERAQGNLTSALDNLRRGLEIMERLAAADRSNTEWQRDLSISYQRVGNVLEAQGKLDDALKANRDSLAIAERLAAADRSNTQWQRDLSVTYNNIGDVLLAQDKLIEALASYRSALAILKALVERDKNIAHWQKGLEYTVHRIGGLAHNFILARDFARALEAADQSISVAPNEVWLYTNRAHALMFVGQVDEARALYLQYRGEKKVQGEKSWETVILEDFAELRKAGLTHPLMDEIEARFAARG
jgi:tetratricopeptide (TPR) repeat protein